MLKLALQSINLEITDEAVREIYIECYWSPDEARCKALLEKLIAESRLQLQHSPSREWGL